MMSTNSSGVFLVSFLFVSEDSGLWAGTSNRCGDDGLRCHAVLASSRDHVELDALWDAGGSMVRRLHHGRTADWTSSFPGI